MRLLRPLAALALTVSLTGLTAPIAQEPETSSPNQPDAASVPAYTVTPNCRLIMPWKCLA